MNLTDENQNLIGIFTTDAELRVQVWDAALEQMTRISAASVRGKSITEIIPNLESRRLLTRFWRVLEDGTVEILAPAFHRFLIPCPPRAQSEHFAEMRQRVTIAPLTENEQIRGLIVTIEDVTTRVEREIELTDQLKNPDDATRLGAAKAISEETENLSGETAVPIIEALDDKNWRVRRELADGLSRRAAPEAIAALLRAMREKHLDFAVLNSALKVLQATSVKTTEPLIEFLEGADADLRMQAALTLGEQRDAQAVPALMKALEDENANVRFHAIEALGKLTAAEAVGKLIEIAEQRDFFLSYAALEALREIRDEDSAPHVLPLLADDGLREAAIETLGAVGGVETVAPLVELLNEDRRAAGAVAHALGELAARFQNDSGVAEHARRAVNESGKSNLLAALEAAKETDAPPLIRLAGWLADENLRGKLGELLENENLREEAARGLVQHGAAAVDLLIERIDTSDEQTHPTIARALGNIGDERAFGPLVVLLETGGAAARLAAAEALKALAHPETVERLCGLLDGSETAVREAAIRVIGYFGAKGCEEKIFEYCADADERVRRAAIEQLPFIAHERSVPTLIRALKEGTSRVRETAAKALAQVKSEESIGALRAALSDEDSWTRYFAVRALGALGDAGVRAELSEMADADAAEHVRAAAREVLGGLGI